MTSCSVGKSRAIRHKPSRTGNFCFPSSLSSRKAGVARRAAPATSPHFWRTPSEAMSRRQGVGATPRPKRLFAGLCPIWEFSPLAELRIGPGTGVPGFFWRARLYVLSEANDRADHPKEGNVMPSLPTAAFQHSKAVIERVVANLSGRPRTRPRRMGLTPTSMMLPQRAVPRELGPVIPAPIYPWTDTPDDILDPPHGRVATDCPCQSGVFGAPR